MQLIAAIFAYLSDHIVGLALGFSWLAGLCLVSFLALSGLYHFVRLVIRW